MNITDAYALNNRSRVRGRKHKGILPISYELLETLLELPVDNRNLRIVGVHPNYRTNTLDVVLESDAQVNGVTFDTSEGQQIPVADISDYINGRN